MLTFGVVVAVLLVGAVTAFARAERALAPKPGCVVEDAGQEATQEMNGELVGLRGELIAEGLNPSTDVTQMPNSSTFLVVEKAGREMAVQDGQVIATPVLDIRNQVSDDWNERGLLSIETHPEFAENCKVFLFFTDVAGHSKLVAATITDSDPLTIDPISMHTILVVPQNHPYHQSGSMAFGPNGYLWVSVGDGGLGNEWNAQNPWTIKGSVIRLDVNRKHYASPRTNPFFRSMKGRPEVWAYGLRNPWRISIDAETNLVYIPDVGMRSTEELNIISLDDGGLNLGWPITEGDRCHEAVECPTDGLTPPQLTYERIGGNCAIVGGQVYRGRAIAELQGHYFFTDFCSGQVRSLLYEDGAIRNETEWEGLEFDGLVTSFGTDNDGELYLTTLAGQLWKVVPIRR